MVEAFHLNPITISKVGKEKPKWKHDDLKSVMSKLVEFGCLDYPKLIDDAGAEVANSLIEHNIFHYQPESRMSYDLPNFADPIVTAESGCSLHAMELFLNKINQY